MDAAKSATLPTADPAPTCLDVDALLAEMAADGQQVATRPSGARPPKMRYRHEALVELVLLHPEWTQAKFAAFFGYTEGWISTIMTSDAFQCLLATKREQLVNPILRMTMEERARALTLKSMEVLQDKLCLPVVSDQLALRAFELGSKAVGLGGNAAPPAVPNAAEFLPAIADRLKALLGRRPSSEIEDAKIVDVSAG